MKGNKFFFFIISTFATSVVVFNNLADVLKKINTNGFDMDLYIAFGAIVIGSMWYVYENIK